MATSQKKLIRFDWAIKSLLRDKANFDVLEGFLAAFMNETERKRYDRYLINLHREIDIIDTAKEDGEKAKAQNMAIIMLQDNMSISLIAKYTGLTEEEIAALANI